MKICLEPAQYRLMYSLQVIPVVCGVNLSNNASYTMTKQLGMNHNSISDTAPLVCRKTEPRLTKNIIRFRVVIRCVST